MNPKRNYIAVLQFMDLYSFVINDQAIRAVQIHYRTATFIAGQSRVAPTYKFAFDKNIIFLGAPDNHGTGKQVVLSNDLVIFADSDLSSGIRGACIDISATLVSFR